LRFISIKNKVKDSRNSKIFWNKKPVMKIQAAKLDPSKRKSYTENADITNYSL